MSVASIEAGTENLRAWRERRAQDVPPELVAARYVARKLRNMSARQLLYYLGPERVREWDKALDFVSINNQTLTFRGRAKKQ